MPNGDGGNLKVMGIFNLHSIPREQWHIVVARHLRSMADEIDGQSRAMFEYSQR